MGLGLGIGIAQLVRVVRDARGLEQRRGAIAIAGSGARELATALAAGGEPGAIAVDGDPARAAAAVWIIDGAPSAADIAALRRAARAGVPRLAVLKGAGSETVPYVFPQDVIEWADDGSLAERLARLLATVLDEGDAVALAGRLPLLRPHVQRRLIWRASILNAAIGAAPWMKEAHMPLMSLAQARMLLALGTTRGDTLPRDPQGLAVAAGPALAGAVGTGLGLRALYRRLPRRGPLAAGGVAYAGTRALGELRARI